MNGILSLIADRYIGSNPPLSFGMKWYPSLDWDNKMSKMSPFIRIFGNKKGCFAFAWSKLVVPFHERNDCIIEGKNESYVSDVRKKVVK